MAEAQTFDDDQPEPNEWVRPVALAVLILMIVWNVSGWVIDKGLTFEGVFLALMTAAFQALSFNASAQMRRAGARVPTPSVKNAHRFWTAILFVCSLWSAGSAHHAYGVIVARDVDWAWSLEAMWAVLGAAPLLVVLTVGAFIEPFLPWGIETVEAAPKKGPVQTPAPVQPTAIESAATKPSPSRRAPNAASRRLAGELRAQRLDGASRREAQAPTEAVEPVSRPVSLDELKTAVAALQASGAKPSIRLVAENLNVKKTRIEQTLTQNQTKLAALVA